MMKILTAYLVSLFVSISSFAFADTKIGDVASSPYGYFGETVTFNDVWIGYSLEIVDNSDDLYTLGAIASSVPDGPTYYTTNGLRAGNLNFIVNQDLAFKIDVANFRTDAWHHSNMTVIIGTLENADGETCYVAAVTKIESTKTDGEVILTLSTNKKYSITGIYTYYISRFTSSDTEWSGISMANLGDSEATIYITYYNELGGVLVSNENINLPINGQNSIFIGDKFGTNGWIKIESDQKLAGFGGMATSSPSTYIADIPLVEELAEKLVIPHVAQDAMWDSMIILCNPNDEGTGVYIDFYNKAGTLLYSKYISLGANASKMCAMSDVVEGTEQTGSVTIRASNPITAFSLYNNIKAGGTYYTGINAVIVD